MIVNVVLSLLAVWLLLSAVVTVVYAAIARGGLHEDRLRGFLVDRL